MMRFQVTFEVKYEGQQNHSIAHFINFLRVFETHRISFIRLPSHTAFCAIF